VRRADLGARIDVTHLQALVEQAFDARSTMRRAHQQVLAGQTLRLPIPATLDFEKATAVLVALGDEINRAPLSAHIDARKKAVVPAEPGVQLDVYGSLERIDHALSRGDTEIKLATIAIPAQGDASRLQHVDMKAVLGDFTTRYARGTIAQDRTHNLQVAASKIDGYVLGPGEVFDFNQIVGNRTALGGFRPAKVIADGELIDGIGGGTCQIASTLHAAVFFAGLPILTRSPHSHPSFYIKLGLDAAVAYGALNFRFRNDRDFPIVLDLTVEDGYVHAALHGRERTRTVTFLRRIDATAPFEEKFVRDPGLPRSMRILQQRGIPGFRSTRFRVIEDLRSGIAVRERSTDTYPPSMQIWRVGIGGEPDHDFTAPRNDPHPEYVTDEILSATQGPGTQGTKVISTPGRTGTPGWIEREGLRRTASGG
jgi:vancomycin resistance protein YoaR